MRLCSYTIVHDYGFAPNPFWGYCSLGVCTPNHQGLKLSKGDWIVGISEMNQGSHLVYAMHVSEVLGMDDYFRDPRFRKKKPDLNGTWKEQCGDNIYFRVRGGTGWKQAPTRFHDDAALRKQDTKYAKVFIAKEFFYFGESSQELPDEFAPFIRDRNGCSCKYSDELVTSFVNWIRDNYAPGIHGNPRDLDDQNAEPFQADLCGSRLRKRSFGTVRRSGCGGLDNSGGA